MTAITNADPGSGIEAIACDHTDDLVVLVAAALAEQYGFADIDGRQPRALTLADV
jgi:hypothetical protein